MNHRQISKKNMYNKVLVFLTTHAAAWASFARLVAEIAVFTDKHNQIEIYLGKQQQETKGVTADKDMKYQTMVSVMVRLARKARVWAVDNDNMTLEAIFDVRMSDFLKVAEEVGESRMKDVRDALVTHIASLAAYNVLPAHLTELNTAIAAFDAVAGTPGAAMGTKKLGTETLLVLFALADKSLSLIDDLITNEYDDLLVMEYKNNRRMDTIGGHYQGMNAHISYLDGSGNAAGVTMTIVELQKSGKSDIMGMVATLRGKVGTYHVRFEGAGIATKEIIASIKQGETLHLAVKMEKV